MLENLDNLIFKLEALQRTVGALNTVVNEQTDTIQQIQETAADQIVPGQHNLVRNGDFDLDRNRYLYETDFADVDPATVDADVSEEAAYWFTAIPDMAVESTGSIDSADNVLTLDTNDFVLGDEDVEIVVEGAGASGSDLITTIDTFVNSFTVELTDNASTDVESVRVRWRLRALTEDSTDEDADGDETTNTALKTEDHSRYEDAGIINDPDYDKANGWARLGSTNWLCAPMHKNYFKASTTYIATFIYRLREAIGDETTYAITPFAGLWDNSEGRRQFLEGRPIEVTGETRGTPIGTTSREYYIVFYTNWGEKIGSEAVTVADAPNDASFITNQVYVYLAWRTPRGVIRTEIYRKTGSDYKLVGLPVQSDFRDNNSASPQSPFTTVGGYPDVDYTRARAYTEATLTNFSPANTTAWQFASFAIHVPFDYDASLLTDKQWMVIGLTDEVAGLERAIEIDKISIDDKIGAYSLCSLDEQAKRGLSSAPTEGSQGNIGGGGFEEPIGCPTFEMTVEVETTSGEFKHVRVIDLIHNEHLYKIVTRQEERKRFKAKIIPPQTIYELTADNGSTLRASKDHPCFENEQDVVGKSLQYLRLGDTILTRNGSLARVASNIRQIKKEYTVQITILDDLECGFWVNGFGCHNFKDVFGNNNTA